jgi:hypothetical protein
MGFILAIAMPISKTHFTSAFPGLIIKGLTSQSPAPPASNAKRTYVIREGSLPSISYAKFLKRELQTNGEFLARYRAPVSCGPVNYRSRVS